MFLGSCALVLLCLPLCIQAVSLPKTAELLPPETVLLVDIHNFNQLAEQFKKTSFYRLYKDPAMAAFVDDVKETIREKIKEANSEFATSMFELELLPRGRAAFVLVVNQKALDAGEPTALFITQWAENLGKIKQTVDRIVKKAIEEGARRQSEDYRGVEINTIIAEGPSRPRFGLSSTLSYCFLDDCLVGSEDVDLLKFTVARIQGAVSQALADGEDYTSTMQATGPAHDIDLYVNTKQIVKMAVAEDSRGEIKTVITNLGLDNVASLGCSVGLGRDPGNGSSAKALLKIDGEKKGLCKMLELESAAMKVPKFAPADFSSATFVNLNVKKAYDALYRIAYAFSPQFAAIMVMPILPPSPDGSPGLTLKADIIDHLGSQLLSFRSIDKSAPATAVQTTEFIIALAANNRNALETSLSRLHALFSQNKPDARRPLLGHTIYLIDLSTILPPFTSGAEPSIQAPSEPPSQIPLSLLLPKIAFTVTDTHLILGLEAPVERAIRTLSAAPDPDAIPKWFAKAKSTIPDVVGLAGLQNDAALAQVVWKTMKESDSSEPKTSDEERSIGIGVSPTGGLSLTQSGIDLVNTGLLPEFDLVRKYFGLFVTYGISRPDGFFFEFKYIYPD
jgi:hypothetical protein